MEFEEWENWWKSGGERELRSLLMEHWDPIGVQGVPEAYDEYDRYLRPLAHELRKGADAQAVAEYLSGIQSNSMGLPATPDQVLPAANRVIDWYSREMQQ